MYHLGRGTASPNGPSSGCTSPAPPAPPAPPANLSGRPAPFTWLQEEYDLNQKIDTGKLIDSAGAGRSMFSPGWLTQLNQLWGGKSVRGDAYGLHMVSCMNGLLFMHEQQTCLPVCMPAVAVVK